MVQQVCIDRPLAYSSAMKHDYAVYKPAIKESTLDKTRALDQFLANVERKAFRIAEIAVGNREEALDIVQDSMFALVRKYANNKPEEWTPLFYRILQSRIRDWYRKNKVRSTWMTWLGFGRKNTDEDGPENPIDVLPDTRGRDPVQAVSNKNSMDELEQAMQRLPLRQQQAFLLRAWQGMSVAETACSMRCSEGSVKTHYSRAVHKLRIELEDHSP